MDDRWYYSHADTRFGPYSSGQLRALAVSGGILPTDTVYKDGVVRGVLASKVKNLFRIPGVQAPVAAPIPAPDFVVVASGQSDLIPSNIPDLVPLDTKPEPKAVAAVEPLAPPPASDRQLPAERPKPGPDRQAQHQRKGRATAGKGVTVVGQDGVYVRFRKKCTTCKHEDYNTNSLAIRNGMMQVNFFCPKCRKNRTVELQGSLN